MLEFTFGLLWLRVPEFEGRHQWHQEILAQGKQFSLAAVCDESRIGRSQEGLMHLDFGAFPGKHGSARRWHQTQANCVDFG